MAIDGYKILWGTTPGAINGVHPVSPDLFNSGTGTALMFDANDVSAPIPAGFWHDSFKDTGVHLRVCSYTGLVNGTPSKVISMYSFGVVMTSSKFYLIHIPLDDGNAHTKATVAENCTNVTVVYNRTATKFVSWIKMANQVPPVPPQDLTNWNVVPGQGLYVRTGASSNTARWVGRRRE